MVNEKIIKIRNLINELYNDCGNIECDKCEFHCGTSELNESCVLGSLDNTLQIVEVD